jgi:branched-chain amino acid aminotransferase
MNDCIGKWFIWNGNSQPVADFNENIFLGKEAIYEVIRVEEEIPVFIEDHLSRIGHTFNLSQLRITLNENRIKQQVNDLIKINKHQSGAVKIIITSSDTIVYLMKPYKPTPKEYIFGVEAALMREERNNPTAKIWNQRLREKTVHSLNEKSVFEVILVNRKGYITEGSRSNVFLIRGECVYTTPPQVILPGITRQKVMEICHSNGINLKEKMIRYSELSGFEVMFLTGTTRKIVPVKRIDNIVFSVESEILKTIINGFERLVAEYIKSKKEINQY